MCSCHGSLRDNTSIREIVCCMRRTPFVVTRPMTVSNGVVVPLRRRPLQVGLGVSPASEGPQQRVPGRRLDGFRGQSSTEPDQRPHLVHMLAAAWARGEMGVKTRAVRFGNGALKVIRDDLDQLLTGHQVKGVIAYVRLRISSGARRHV